MNSSHVIYGACMRDCGVEGYGGPQGPRKLLDNEEFGLATWEHQGWFQHLALPIGNKGKPLPSINWEAFAGQNQPLLAAASFSATMRTHLPSSFQLLQAFQRPSQSSTFILWLLQASQQLSTNISWLLNHPSNHQTTFVPPFSCCKHSSGHPSHSSTITIMFPTFSPLKSIIFSIKPHQAELQAFPFSSYPSKL
ncbi:hypothetical protein Pyn_19058 [Prunus yedoensis var. nudiflora]|uniref:Uncharacterized protein n=1 Tax=Prunus yedoensis var. nudiflora TaxID=2094558 RepID=A0A314YQR8_PRUYE|nr:hypothetical protein Pyn_19058 [Prunus yedoensis var. nudiflora]